MHHDCSLRTHVTRHALPATPPFTADDVAIYQQVLLVPNERPITHRRLRVRSPACASHISFLVILTPHTTRIPCENIPLLSKQHRTTRREADDDSSWQHDCNNKRSQVSHNTITDLTNDECQLPATRLLNSITMRYATNASNKHAP